MAAMNMIQALNSAHKVAMAGDPDVVVYGEDVGYFGGVFRVTEGLQSTFGQDAPALRDSWEVAHPGVPHQDPGLVPGSVEAGRDAMDDRVDHVVPGVGLLGHEDSVRGGRHRLPARLPGPG